MTQLPKRLNRVDCAKTLNFLIQDIIFLFFIFLKENIDVKKAIVLEYNLPPSSYATMALRELIKNN